METSISKKMKMDTNIFDLPSEILAKVINLAGNKEARLACKHFYAVYSGFTSCKLTFKFDKIPDDIFDSMIFSLRRTTELSIENVEISFDDKFKKVIAHFAAHVKELTFKRQNKDIPIKEFEYIMRSMTNLLELNVEELKIDATRYEIKQMKKSPIILPHLTKLSLTYYDLKSMWIVMCLQSNSLDEFHFHGNNVYDFTQFFERHKNIKNVTLSGKLRHSKGYEHLQLTHLRIYNCKNEFLHDMSVHQPRLQHLELLYKKELISKVPKERLHWSDDTFSYELAVDDNVFQAICDLTQLETLSIQIGRLTANVIGNISKLANLKKLDVRPSTQGYCDQTFGTGENVNRERACLRCEPYKEIFRTLIAIPLSTLESFTWLARGCGVGYMQFMKIIDLDCSKIVQMAKCFPNLKYLAIKIKELRSRGDKINVHTILQEFKQLKALELQITSTFEGSSVQMHNNIERIRIEMMDGTQLTDMMRTISMQNLYSLDSISELMLKRNFLQNVKATIPNDLKDLKLVLRSDDKVDLNVDNFNIMSEIFGKLHSCKIIISCGCDFDVAAKIIELIDQKMNVSLQSNVIDNYHSEVSHDVILWK